MRDILEKNCDRILEEHAEAVKKALPNRRHFEKLRDDYDKLAEEYSQKYATQNKDMLEIFEIMMHEISGMSKKTIEEVEDELLGFAALMYSETLKRYGGIRTVREETENIMLTKVGKTKTSFAFLIDVFRIWEDRERCERYRSDFIWWYNRENSM